MQQVQEKESDKHAWSEWKVFVRVELKLNSLTAVGMNDEVALLLTQPVWEPAAERAARGFHSLVQGVRGVVPGWRCLGWRPPLTHHLCGILQAVQDRAGPPPAVPLHN